ncbi:LLM class flavin-dependent oxidoreductase [Streptomyces chartreusis]|uniref:LLM class flavin-dependent oxidoreductase n=1 Tax=Streptomyces chartreusis TaxID=1969 RepID=UPI00368B67EF
MEIGVFTFADVAVGEGGTPPSRRIPELIEEIALADEVGLDVFGIGEHHRVGYAAAAPVVLLAAGAARTRRIRLTSAVTVLSTDDPVRVFEQFTALDHVSRGRAEVMVGRGAFPDSFRLFAEDGDDYDDVFDEKLRLLTRLRRDAPVTWSGRHRPDLVDEYLYPRPTQAELPVWVAVGGSPESAVRAGRVGAPMGIVALGGSPRRLAPLADLHRQALEQYGHPPQPLGLHLHGFVADTSQKAIDVYGPAETEVMNRTFGERGFPPLTLDDFEAKTRPGGVYAVGSPAQVIDKILTLHELLGQQRTMLQLAVGTVPHHELMRAIELLGTQVVPAVRAATARANERSEPAKEPR